MRFRMGFFVFMVARLITGSYFVVIPLCTKALTYEEGVVL